MHQLSFNTPPSNSKNRQRRISQLEESPVVEAEQISPSSSPNLNDEEAFQENIENMGDYINVTRHLNDEQVL